MKGPVLVLAPVYFGHPTGGAKEAGLFRCVSGQGLRRVPLRKKVAAERLRSRGWGVPNGWSGLELPGEPRCPADGGTSRVQACPSGNRAAAACRSATLVPGVGTLRRWGIRSGPVAGGTVEGTLTTIHLDSARSIA